LSGTAAALRALQRVQSGEAAAEDFDILGERWDLPERLRQSLDNAGLPDIAPTDLTLPLSGGQQARLALIGAFLSPARLLVLDEPTNHLDGPGRDWLMSELERWRGGLIVISHDRQLLERMQRIVELTPLGVTVYGGNFSAYQQQRQIHQAAAQATPWRTPCVRAACPRARPRARRRRTCAWRGRGLRGGCGGGRG